MSFFPIAHPKLSGWQIIYSLFCDLEKKHNFIDHGKILLTLIIYINLAWISII